MVDEGDKETVARFSAGVSSFVAAYLAKPDRIVFINVASQHPDTLRFVADAERVLGRPIEIIGDQRYRQSVDVVIAKRRYINGPAGACCTTELKKRVRQEWERKNAHPGMVYVWGYDADERRRAERTAAASEFGVSFPLIERGLTKENCHAIAAELGIKRPAMYDLGYSNNNCVGCVKGGRGYWNKIRRDFPEVFERRAKQEREVGRSCIKGVFLDELDPTSGNMAQEVMPICSFDCIGVLDDVE